MVVYPETTKHASKYDVCVTFVCQTSYKEWLMPIFAKKQNVSSRFIGQILISPVVLTNDVTNKTPQHKWCNEQVILHKWCNEHQNYECSTLQIITLHQIANNITSSSIILQGWLFCRSVEISWLALFFFFVILLSHMFTVQLVCLS